MVEFKLNLLKDNAYKKVIEAIHDYVFSVGVTGDFIVKLAVGNNAKTANHIHEVAYRYDNNIIFLNDWWEGEPYVAVLGILPVTDVTDFDDIKAKEQTMDIITRHPEDNRILYNRFVGEIMFDNILENVDNEKDLKFVVINLCNSLETVVYDWYTDHGKDDGFDRCQIDVCFDAEE